MTLTHRLGLGSPAVPKHLLSFSRHFVQENRTTDQQKREGGHSIFHPSMFDDNEAMYPFPLNVESQC